MNPKEHARRLALRLAVSFALTIASFLVARIVSDYLAHGIEDAASTISQHTIPAVESLGSVRTELRRKASLLDTLAGADVSTEDVRALRDELAHARIRMERSWAAYTATPVFAGERDLIVVIESQKRELDTSIDRALHAMSEGDHATARAEISARARPAITQTDEAVHAAAVLNRRITTEAAARIKELRTISRTWGFALDGACAVLASASAYLIMRVLRRFWALLDERLVEMEHFTGRVAHDIRSPLSTVVLALDLVKRRTEGDAQTQSIVERGLRTVQRIRQLVDGLLVFATAGKPYRDEETARVSEVLEGVVEDLRPVAEEKEIRIACEAPAATSVVACSPGVLVSILSNLLGNAVKYMGDAPVREVTVRVREAERTVRVDVEDTGPGIPEALRSTVFDPHVRGAEAAVPGLGLGLATVRRLVEAHGGTVSLRAGDRAGCIFSFQLPKSEGARRRSLDG